MADLAQRYQVHPNQIYARKKQLQEQASRAFGVGGGTVSADHEREVERLPAKIGGLWSGFFARRTGSAGPRNSARPRP